MERLDAAHLREQALIWATALVLAFLGLKAAQRALPGPFAVARAQLAIEARDAGWIAQDLRAGRVTVLTGPSGLSVAGLRRRVDAENNYLAAGLAGHVVIRRDDLLERANRGLR